MGKQLDTTTKYPNYKSTGRGFYYDIQRENPLTSITLHANAINNGGSLWKEWPKDDVDEDGYGKEALCTSIMTEDFSVNISNNWTDFDGGNSLTGLWNSVKPFAPFASFVSDKGEELIKNGKEALAGNSDIRNSKFAQTLQEGAEMAKPYIDKASNYLNRALVIQGTRFSYYSGTSTNFSNLSMKFTVFADWFDGKFKTVEKQLEKLYPYIMGKYVKWDESKENDINDFVGWQKPPAGFKADVKSVDNIQFGTLKLKFGSFYSLTNLVVRDAQLNFSKQMVKNPEVDKRGEISPLYCDVMINLQAVTKYSDISLKKFISGRGMTKEREETKKVLNSSLKSVKKDIRGLVDDLVYPKSKDKQISKISIADR